MLKRFLPILLLTLPTLAQAAETKVADSSPLNSIYGPVIRALTSQAINTACVANPSADDTPSCASFEVRCNGYNKVWVGLDYTHSAASAVQLYVDDSADGGVPWFVRQAGDGSTVPTITMGDHKVEWPGTPSTGAWGTWFDCNMPYLRFRITSTGGSASDTVSAYYRLKGER